MTLYGFTSRRSSGVKTFSSCSLSAFENFISNMGARCLQNKPRMRKSAVALCGNGRVEIGEDCDCGTEEVSLINKKVN